VGFSFFFFNNARAVLQFLPFFVLFWIAGQINFYNGKKSVASLFYNRKKFKHYKITLMQSDQLDKFKDNLNDKK